MEIATILWREWTFFKHRFFKISFSQMISPTLYLITFGIGLGNKIQIDGKSYLFFLIPGLLSMVTMRNSYSSVAMRISISRLHEKSFETYIYAPTKMANLAIGYILSGAFRGMYASIFVVILSYLSSVDINISINLFFLLFLNSIIFSSLGFIAAMSIDTHYDLNRFTNMVITPMSFLCGTFYSVSTLPWFFKLIVEFLPLTHTTRLIRRVSFGYGIDMFSLLVIIFYIIVFIILSIRICYEEIRD
ncbi:MAG: ABC transporter permease [Bacillota bacterium]|nr:ABC transporter permease [Bacillota bacterium]